MRRRVTVVGYVCVCVCVCVCVFVCVSSSIFSNSNKSAKKTYGSPQRCIRLIYNVFFFFHKTASSWRYRIWVAAILAYRSAILLVLTGARAYIHSCDVALNHVVFLLQGLPLWLARHYMAHVHIFITSHWPQPRAIVRLKEGMVLYNF